MPDTFQLVTERLLLRPFEARDRTDFAAMNADPEVMRFFPNTFSEEESAQHMARYQDQLSRDGFSFYVVEERDSSRFLGTIGLQTMRVVVPNLPQPAVELGWRLAADAQGLGYATEGARALVEYAFGTLRLTDLVAVTTHANKPSRRVMEKLGMRHRPELTYEDPRVAAGHPLQPHVLYQLNRTTGHSCSIPS